MEPRRTLRGVERVNVHGTRNVVALGAPVVYFSTDYVFDGRKGAPYLESDEPSPLSVYGGTKLAGERELRQGWIVRSSWLFGWTGKNFVRTMLALGARQDEVAVVADQRGAPRRMWVTSPGDAQASSICRRAPARRRRGRLHLGRFRRGRLR